MRNTLALLLALPLLLASCAGKTPPPALKEEKNKAKFAESRAFTEKPELVLAAAHAALDELTRESDPPASGPVQAETGSVKTGWVHGRSRDKYVQYDYNGSPRRKQLTVRRQYSAGVQPALAGSQVELGIEEELEEVDLKTGLPKGWKSVKPDPAAFDLLMKRIRDRIRSQ